MSKARIYGMPRKGLPNNRRDPKWKERKMDMDVFKRRSDMDPPCKDCPGRYPGCRDTCRDPDFLRAMDLQQKAKQDTAARKQQAREQLLRESRRENFRRTSF